MHLQQHVTMASPRPFSKALIVSLRSKEVCAL